MSTRHPSRTGIAERIDSRKRRQYRGTAYDRRARRHLRGPWTPSLAEARAWRVDALARLQTGTLSAAQGPTLREAAEEFLTGIHSGAIHTRASQRYKPSTIAGYERDLRGPIMEAFGAARLARIALPDVQRFADSLLAGRSPSRVRGILNALRALYGWALPRGMAVVNPTKGLRLPSGERARTRIATPAEAAALIAALRPQDQAAFGLAVYAGLRMGELLALEWGDVDLERSTARVRRAWDHVAREFVEPKSRAGARTVPLASRLVTLLADHRVLMNHPEVGLLFPGRGDAQPVHPTSLRESVAKVLEARGLRALGFHEARHTAASVFIASGMNAKTVSALLGHASIAITFDRYGHLFAGAEHEARGLLDAYLERDGD
jgi:integrase